MKWFQVFTTWNNIIKIRKKLYGNSKKTKKTKKKQTM